MDNSVLLLALFLGLGLAASSGLNTCLPLLSLACVTRFHLLPLQLGPQYAWLKSDAVLAALACAVFVEIIADKIPAVDHSLDAIGTVTRPVAGAVASAAVLQTHDPALATVAAIVIGAPTAFRFHSAKAGARLTSSAGTFGCLNPVLSVLEDCAALALIFIALFIPFLVPLFLLLFGLVLWRMVQWAKTKRRQANA